LEDAHPVRGFAIIMQDVTEVRRITGSSSSGIGRPIWITG